MAKMLLKDFAALACGLICAILCFSLLLHYNVFKPAESAAKYPIQHQGTTNGNGAINDY